MNNLLNRVTFTGVDDKTNIDDLVYLAEKYPFVEFGILVSKNNSNSGTVNRYPNLTILKRLKNKGLNLSCQEFVEMSSHRLNMRYMVRHRVLPHYAPYHTP